MFWKRKPTIVGGACGPLMQMPVPAKKQFTAMLEILKDAEKYDNKGEYEVSDAILKDLCTYIETYLSKNKKK